jgi:hypothetical protein
VDQVVAGCTSSHNVDPVHLLIDVRREERTRLASLNFLRSEDGRNDAEIAAHVSVLPPAD